MIQNIIKPNIKINMGLFFSVTLFAIITLASFFSAYINSIEIQYAVYFLLFQILGIMIPGIAIVSIIRFKSIDMIQFITIAYMCGYGVNILEYLILYSLEIQQYTIGLFVLVFFSSVILLWKARKNILVSVTDTGMVTTCLIFICTFAFISFWVFNMRNILPSLQYSGVSYNQDLLFWIENSVALAKSFPPVNLRFHGEVLKYHYFTSMQMALMQKIVPINMHQLSTCFAYITPIIMMVGAFYTLLKEFIRRKGLLAISLFILLFTTGGENGKFASFVTYIHHIAIVPFGFDYGLAFMVLFIFFLYKLMKGPCFQKPIFFLSLFILLIATGLKGPSALIGLLVAGIVCVYWIIKKKYWQGIICGISYLSLFIFIYLAFIHTNIISKSTTDIQPLYHVLKFADSAKIYTALNNLIRMKYFSAIIACGAWVIGNNPCIFIPFGIGSILCIMNYKQTTAFDIILFVVSCIGLTMTMCLKMNGASQMYFAMSIYPVALLFGINKLDEYYDRIFCTRESGALFSIGAGGIVMVGALLYAIIIIPYVRIGVKNYSELKNQQQQRIQMNSEIPASVITYEKYEALDWIRQNTPENSLIIHDGGTLLEGVNFTYGAFAERHCYFESSYAWGNEHILKQRRAIVADVYSGSIDALKWVIEDGVEFLVQTHSITPSYRLDNRFGISIFQNNEITVYKLQMPEE